jgi:DNA-binding response OmpR family regulator
MGELEALLEEYSNEGQGEKPIGAGVMVIDDDPSIRRALRRTFQKRGYAVVECKTGEEALNYLAHEPGDIKAIILDVKLPKIDGNQVYRMIKQVVDIPIIIHTAYAGEDAPNSRSLGAFAYIHKGTPGSYEELVAAVDGAVR